MWDVYGFRSTPYSTTALGPEAADGLLVGREEELRSLHRDLVSGASLMALEGDYGVGKSSLAATAAFSAAGWDVHQGDPWFLATPRPLELVATESVDEFERRAYYQVAAAILVKARRLASDGNRLEGAQALSEWLLSPAGSGWNAGIGLSAAVLGGFELSGGRNRTTNSTPGFNDAGIIALIDGWLNELFPDASRGGVILRLDNLELLGRDYRLVETFEALRDRLFKRQGLRWIISGAEGMVRTALGSPKMTGAFADPLDLPPIAPEHAPEVIRRRAEILSTRDSYTLPVDPELFEETYLNTGRNLRFTLGLADRYALRSDPGTVTWMNSADRAAVFRSYVEEEGRLVVTQLAARVSPAAWKVLTTLVRAKSGFASPSEFRDFGYANMASLLHQVRALRSLGLVEYAVDEEDARRRRIIASNNGRLAVAVREPGISEAASPSQ